MMARLTIARFVRRALPSCAGVLAVLTIAALWARIDGPATARLLRRGFVAFDPEVVLDVATALVIVGVGARLLPIRLDPRGGRLVKLGSRVSTAVAVSSIVAVAAVFRIVLGAANHTPKVLGDELVYSGLAKGWALHGEPLLRGSLDVGHSTLYPLLLAPVFRWSANGASAAAAVKVINAVVIALTAIPAFALARRAVPRSWALGVAALSVLMPWTVYSALTMTESLFYPVFVAYAAVLAGTLAQPSAARQVATLGTLAVLVGVRAQGLTVALGTVAAILLVGALDGSVRAALLRFRLTLVVFGLGLAGGLAAAVTGIAVPTSSYNVVFDSLGRLGGMLKWGAWNLASLELALGVVAVAALPVALRGMLRRGAAAPARATAAVALMLSLSLLASVALLSASPYGLHVLHERSLFYVTPLVLACLAHWLHGGLERPFRLSASCAVASVALVALLPQHVVFHSNNVDAPSSSFFLALDAQIPSVPFRVWAILIAAVGAGTFLVAKRPLFPILTVVLAFAAITSQADYTDTLTGAQAKALSWVDPARPAGATPTLVYLGVPYSGAPCAAPAAAEQQDLTIWTEFFNTHIAGVRYVYEPNPRDGLAARGLTEGPGGVMFDDRGKPVRLRYVVIDSRQPIVGKRLDRFDLSALDSEYQNGASLTLWRVDPPLRFKPRADPLPPRGDGRNC